VTETADERAERLLALGLGDPQRCGTQRAVSRHRRRGEKLDVACLAFDAKRKQRGRVAA
jgi:hypothetical protein